MRVAPLTRPPATRRRGAVRRVAWRRAVVAIRSMRPRLAATAKRPPPRTQKIVARLVRRLTR